MSQQTTIRLNDPTNLINFMGERIVLGFVGWRFGTQLLVFNTCCSQKNNSAFSPSIFCCKPRYLWVIP